jgi:hypothetical protein
MPNHFPGIDPFIEASGDWPDFHSTFMNAWRESIAECLPDDYIARLDERLTVVEVEEDRVRRSAPDIVISQARQRTSAAHASTAQIATLEPETIRITIEEEIRETFIQILRHSDRKLVAVLELLSPANKVGEGRGQYLAKRQAVLMSDAHLVELDLLIGGRRLPMENPLPAKHFHAVISRAGKRPNCEVYSWSLDHPMPTLPVPLASPDPDIFVNLAEVLATTYQRGRYYKTINYQSPLDLPLSPDYAAWVQQVVAQGNR